MSESSIEVTLREITKDNWRDLLRLKVAPSQEQFVASNAMSIAEAHFNPEVAWFRAIYAGDVPVGFLMLEDDVVRQEYFLWRFMIDEQYQGRGYGRKALELFFAHVKTRPGADAVETSCVPAKGGPGSFYEKMGFVYTGQEENGELVMRRELRSNNRSTMTIEIRLFEARDADRIAQLFHETVREINVRDYSSKQVRAWAPDDLYFRNWVEVCSSRFTYVADDGVAIAGFGELEPNGHIDCFYCHKNYQRCGVGSQIYRAIEAKAVELSVSRLFTEASITAKSFFQRMGFSVVKEQEVTHRGETFINYAMEKFL